MRPRPIERVAASTPRKAVREAATIDDPWETELAVAELVGPLRRTEPR